MKRNFQEYIERKQREHGDKFNLSELAPNFVHYFETGERIKVRMSYGETKTGTVGITTGWKPVFLLMSRSSAIGSATTLSTQDQIIAVKQGRTYQAVKSYVKLPDGGIAWGPDLEEK